MPRHDKPRAVAHEHPRNTGRGDYGNPGYGGNCSGLLIRDLLSFFRPKRVLDPMEGGGTCRDVCKELAIPYEGRDLKTGFDATRAESFEGLGVFDFVWLHPPYFQMIRYNGSDGRCLSNAPTLAAFVDGLRSVFRNCRGVLSERGKLAVLMGDGKHEGRYMGLPFRTLNAAAAEGYWLASPRNHPLRSREHLIEPGLLDVVHPTPARRVPCAGGDAMNDGCDAKPPLARGRSPPRGM